VFGPTSSAPTIPLGLSYFPKELLVFPKRYACRPFDYESSYHESSWIRKMGNIVFEREHDSGGHFAAYEKPNELVDDLRQMFGKEGPAFGVVSGKSGC
jgi:hypothetical protein